MPKPNAARATHKGTCQVCGREQMLPRSNLSLHGYQVKWNMFTGTCPGSEELPFEQDKALAEKYLASAMRDQIAAVEYAVELETCDPADHRAWVQVRVPEKRYGFGSTYRDEVHVLELLPALTRSDSGCYSWVGYVDELGKIHAVHSYGINTPYGDDGKPIIGESHLQAYVREMNNKFSQRGPRSRAEQLKGYIGWMQGRLKGWTVKPLKKRKEGE